jgi:hypothetical protein
MDRIMDEAGTVREQVLSGLPQWRSHKVVRAAPVRALYPHDTDPNKMVLYLDGGPDPDGYPGIEIEAKVFSRYVPQPGDYFVVYDDSYQSVSPRKAFEEGYSQANMAEA